MVLNGLLPFFGSGVRKYIPVNAVNRGNYGHSTGNLGGLASNGDLIGMVGTRGTSGANFYTINNPIIPDVIQRGILFSNNSSSAIAWSGTHWFIFESNHKLWSLDASGIDIEDSITLMFINNGIINGINSIINGAVWVDDKLVLCTSNGDIFTLQNPLGMQILTNKGNVNLTVGNPSSITHDGTQYIMTSRSNNNLFTFKNIDDLTDINNIGSFPSELQGPRGLTWHNSYLVIGDTNDREIWILNPE